MLAVRYRVVAEAFLERRDLGLHVEQRFERHAGFFAQRASAVGEAVLRQVADREPRRLDDCAGVRLVDAREHLKQRGLAGAVGTAQADPLAVVDLPGHRIEQDAVAEGFGE